MVGRYEFDVFRSRSGIISVLVVPHRDDGTVLESGVRVYAFDDDEAQRLAVALWCAVPSPDPELDPEPD